MYLLTFRFLSDAKYVNRKMMVKSSKLGFALFVFSHYLSNRTKNHKVRGIETVKYWCEIDRYISHRHFATDLTHLRSINWIEQH